MAYLKIKRSSDSAILEFSEVEVFDFISGRTHGLKRLASWFGFQIFRPETLNRLKDICIHNLLNKKLIDFSRAEKMQRYFKIVNTRVSDYWYEQYRAEKAKNEVSANATET